MENSRNYITYRQFGAAGDGKTNDIEAIVRTHQYANAHHLPVRADDGAVYYIGEAECGAIIRTDTDWTGGAFIIDDSRVPVEARSVALFTVLGGEDKGDETSTKLKKSGSEPDAPFFRIPLNLTGPANLKKGQANLGVTLPQKCIVRITDSTTMQYIRYGPNQDNGTAKTDILCVEPDGSIDQNAPLIWDYDNITEAYAIPVDREPLTLRGGRFTTIANQAESRYTYYGRGILIRRSNVTVDGLEHYVEGELDHGAPYSGILMITHCAFVDIRNCVFTAHKIYDTIGSAGVPVSMGSYDITANNMISLSFRNCRQTTDILDRRYWGLMGSNSCKNISLDGCIFSRFDAHRGVANVTIRNSTLGHQCLNAIGCGTILVENTELFGHNLISLRSDYGSTWEGDAIIRNCVWHPNQGRGADASCSVIGGRNIAFHDFGYECYMPAFIDIDGLRVEDGVHEADYDGIRLFGDLVPECTDGSFAEELKKHGAREYHVTEKLRIRNFSSASGRKWKLSNNPYLYRNLDLLDEDR